MHKTADEVEVIVRCRLVAIAFNTKVEKDQRRVLLWRTVRYTKSGPRQLLFIDAPTALMNPKCIEEGFGRLPPATGHGKFTMGKLLYGCRGEAQAWGDHHGDKVFGEGPVCGTCNILIFLNPGRDLWCV